MKRSEINAILLEARSFIASCQFHLPPFAAWTIEDWNGVGLEAQEIALRGLGWDVTDFGSGDYGRCGLLLFTIRNGDPRDLETLRATLRHLQNLEPDVVLPCHGATSDAGLLTRNLEYFDELEQRVRAGETWSFEDVLRWMNLESDQVEDFYREFHKMNLEAMSASVNAL